MCIVRYVSYSSAKLLRNEEEAAIRPADRGAPSVGGAGVLLALQTVKGDAVRTGCNHVSYHAFLQMEIVTAVFLFFSYLHRSGVLWCVCARVCAVPCSVCEDR